MKGIIILIVALTLPSLFSRIESSERKLIVMRHGEAEHNIADTLNADPSHPAYVPVRLTPLGKKQARAAADHLRDMGVNPAEVAVVFVSPLPRTRQTARYLVHKGIIDANQVVVDERLTEVKMGELEGASIADLDWDHWDHSNAELYGGETDDQVRDRVQHLLREAMRLYPYGHVLIITHGSPALEIIDTVVGERPRLETAEVRVLPMNSIIERWARRF